MLKKKKKKQLRSCNIGNCEIIYKLMQNFFGTEKCGNIERHFILTTLMRMKAMSDISENILKSSQYIPLRIIAEEIIAEHSESEEQFGKLLQTKESRNVDDCFWNFDRKHTALNEKLLKDFERTKAKKTPDETYMYLMLKNDKSTVKQVKNAMKYTESESFKKQLTSLSKRAEIRKEKTAYLLNVQR